MILMTYAVDCPEQRHQQSGRPVSSLSFHGSYIVRSRYVDNPSRQADNQPHDTNIQPECVLRYMPIYPPKISRKTGAKKRGSILPKQ